MRLALLSPLSLVYAIYERAKGGEVAGSGKMENQLYLTRSQLAELFGVSPHTVTRWAREGRLPSIMTLGGQRRYPRESVERLVQELRQEVPHASVQKLPLLPG